MSAPIAAKPLRQHSHVTFRYHTGRDRFFGRGVVHKRRPGRAKWAQDTPVTLCNTYLNRRSSAGPRIYDVVPDAVTCPVCKCGGWDEFHARVAELNAGRKRPLGRRGILLRLAG